MIRGHYSVLRLKGSAAVFGNLTYLQRLLAVFSLIRACHFGSNPLLDLELRLFVNSWPSRWSFPCRFYSGWLRANQGQVEGGFSQSPWIPNWMPSSSGSIRKITFILHFNWLYLIPLQPLGNDRVMEIQRRSLIGAGILRDRRKRSIGGDNQHSQAQKGQGTF